MVSIRKLIEKDESFEGYLLLPSLVRQRCLEVSKSTIKSCDNDNLPEYEYLRVKLSNFTVHGKKHRLVHLALHAEINLEIQVGELSQQINLMIKYQQSQLTQIDTLLGFSSIRKQRVDNAQAAASDEDFMNEVMWSGTKILKILNESCTYIRKMNRKQLVIQFAQRRSFNVLTLLQEIIRPLYV
jgi:hypothetical protein